MRWLKGRKGWRGRRPDHFVADPESRPLELEPLERRVARRLVALAADQESWSLSALREHLRPLRLDELKATLDDLEARNGLVRRRQGEIYVIELDRERLQALLDGPEPPPVARPGALSRPSGLA